MSGKVLPEEVLLGSTDGAAWTQSTETQQVNDIADQSAGNNARSDQENM